MYCIANVRKASQKIWSSHYDDIWLHRTSLFLVPYGTRQCHQLQIFTVQIVARFSAWKVTSGSFKVWPMKRMVVVDHHGVYYMQGPQNSSGSIRSFDSGK